MTEFLHPRDHRADGSAYGRPAQHANALWTEVGPGKPMGELLRRYWHPIAIAGTVTDLPRAVKVLGEDLVLFRDGSGRAGLVYPRCMHRGTTLLYGKVEERGIRCCYHGWLFDVEGRCLEQPCEPDAGHPLRDRFRQPWYPVEERYGLVFAYLGPPEKKPVLPRFDNLEDLAADEKMFVNIGGRGSTGDNSLDVVPYSWLHMNDNIMDPFHVQVLHSTFSGPQFVAQFAVMPTVRLLARRGRRLLLGRAQAGRRARGRPHLVLDLPEHHERARHPAGRRPVERDRLGRAGRRWQLHPNRSRARARRMIRRPTTRRS